MLLQVRGEAPAPSPTGGKVTEVRCWRCDKKLGESTLGRAEGRLVITCPRCKAPNVIQALDKEPAKP